MKDYLYLSFSFQHGEGERARTLLAECGLLEEAAASPLNRHSWGSRLHAEASLRLPAADPRLVALQTRLRDTDAHVFTRVDREYARRELDAAPWLVMTVAAAGLYGGVDYGQPYEHARACATCGAGAEVVGPLIAELTGMGKKDADHLVYEGHVIVTRRVAEGLAAAGVSGFAAAAVRPRRGPPSARFAWLRVGGECARAEPTSEGLVARDRCPTCGRGGHYGDMNTPLVLRYRDAPDGARDLNLTWEYFGEVGAQRNRVPHRPVGGARLVVASQKVRRVLRELGVRRIAWTPVEVGPGGRAPVG